ncbi:MAG TPA: PIN domain-containing protein, partial [Mycobacteriales bacterium]|nr:PIN domain-containing protein [Mycobacteriales bacterium]
MLLVDTGVIFAVADAADGDHDRCEGLLATHPEPLLVPTPVVVEAAWLIESRLGPAAEVAFLRSLIRKLRLNRAGGSARRVGVASGGSAGQAGVASSSPVSGSAGVMLTW